MSLADLLGPPILAGADDDSDDQDVVMPAANSNDNDDDNNDGSEEDGGGVDLMGDGTGDEDSSEEEEEGSEEEREVRAGFIVDEPEASSSKRHKKKHRKHKNEDASRKRRKASDDDNDDLDEDDLALLEENTGVKLTRGDNSHKLKRLRRHRSASAGSDDDDPVVGLRNIFDDNANDLALNENEMFDADEMEGFIEDDTQSEDSGRHGSGSEDEEDRAARKSKGKGKKKKEARGKGRKDRRKRGGFGQGGFAAGISAEAWQDVTDAFGNGQDYAWAMDDEADEKEEKELKDIFEPAEIASRMLTEADDVIRALDVPERMQVASVGLPQLSSEDENASFIQPDDLQEAAIWMSSRISPRRTDEFLLKDDQGNYPPLHDEFITAISNVIKFINIDLFEVPFIWSKRSDFLVHFDPTADDPALKDIAFLDQADLWKISALSIKWRALSHRKSELKKLFAELEVEDDYFEELFSAAETVEEVSDVSEWVLMKFGKEVAELKATKDREAELEGEGTTRIKRASRESIYANAKKNVVSKLAEAIAISATQLSQAFVTLSKTHFIDDPTEIPEVFAEQFAGSKEYDTGAVALAAAQMILVHEISQDPVLRKEARRFFRTYAVVSVRPTDKGLTKIDEMHPFYAFKYLEAKPVGTFLRSPQFLQILLAESEGLVTASVSLPEEARAKFLSDLSKMYNSDYTSSLAEAWNSIRTEILVSAVDDHLLPAAEKWARNWLREEEEDVLGKQCAGVLDKRINVAPFCRSDDRMEKGDTPSVLAISHGSGDPKRDSVVAVYLDNEGRFREHAKFDNLQPFPVLPEDGVIQQKAAFKDLLRRRRPHVIVIGGYSASTKLLKTQVESIAAELAQEIFEAGEDKDEDEEEDGTISEDVLRARATFEITFVFDDVARIYQNSKRAVGEFPELPTLGKYCVGLARYAQNPLLEYAALGPDLAAVTFDSNQNLLSKEKILLHLEQAIVEVTNRVGVDINRAVRDPYYYHLLPFISGLGPRKASALVKKINGPIGGTLTSRQNLITLNILTYNIFLNAAAFLRIRQDELAADLKRDVDLEAGQPDILDDTRIHPEDYDVARKMASDAIEYDEEDIANLDVPSQAVAVVMEPDNVAKLDDLSLDDFASELQKILEVPKRLTLYGIRDEMKRPYGELRRPFEPPSAVEIFTMLTGETRATLDTGLIVPVRVLRLRMDGAVSVRLDSGIEGMIPEAYRTEGDVGMLPKPKPGQILQALVMELRHETFEVELSTQEGQIAAGDHHRRAVMTDPYYNLEQAGIDKLTQASVGKTRSGGRIRRQIDHINFHNFNAGEAEQFLANRQRGDCVIRPSSKEDHLAVTWKVDEGVYQHIAVTEIDKHDEYSIGTKLRVDSRHVYDDLDELIEGHIKSMARKVEEMMAHEKYKGTKANLVNVLNMQTMANPGTSAYGFGLERNDPKLAGQFVVSFRANDKAEIQSWPVKVVPNAFSLFGEEHGDVTALCNAFKIAYIAKVNGKNSGPTPRHLGARTPGYLGGRTPSYNSPSMRPAGRATPLVGSGLGLGRGTPLGAAGRATPLPTYTRVAAGASPFLSGPVPASAPGAMTPLYPNQQQPLTRPPLPGNYNQGGQPGWQGAQGSQGWQGAQGGQGWQGQGGQGNQGWQGQGQGYQGQGQGQSQGQGQQQGRWGQ